MFVVGMRGETGRMARTDLDLVRLRLDREDRSRGDRSWVDFWVEMVDFERVDGESGDLVAGDATREGDIDGFPEERDSDETCADASSLKRNSEGKSEQTVSGKSEDK